MDGKPLTMQVDTGAAVSILSADTFRKLFPNANLHASTLLLRTYTGETMKVLGELPVRVQYDQQGPMELELVVVQGHGPALFGRNWLKHIRLNWKNIGAILYDEDLTRILSNHDELFSDELGTIHPFSVKLSIVSNATPKFCKARQVPYALRGAVEEELDRLEHRGVLERVDHTNWATPIVAVPKKDGKTRICGDYKVTINPVLEVEQYPLPKPEDLFATLAGGKRFTTLDLSHAYNQLVLDEDSQELVTINTHRGLFRYRRLPFGIASAPAVFQKTMDVILQGMSRVTCYLDDILVTGATAEEHLRNLDEVLTRLKKHRVWLRKDKCRFMESSVEYLGHRVDQEGIHATTSKLQAISEAPAPRNVQELRSFLGLLNYYGRFIPNLSSLIHPLHKLLCKNAAWKWSRSCESAFNRAKQALLSSNALVHYNPSLPLKLAGDASAYGVGAVISHVMEDGSERAIAFASRTLSPSEQNYAQLEKEALSLVFGVKKFHAYLYGRQFTLTTDHKPLTTILGPKQGIPTLAAARLQRWALLLAAYTYQIEFRSTGHHANADSLSHLPLPAVSQEAAAIEPTLFNISQLESLPVTSTQLRTCICQDCTLSKVLRCTKEGWPERCNDITLKPYWHRRHEITVEQECVLWGIRAVIPEKLRGKLLEELHRDHPGMSRMKAVARSYMWWPGLDGDIERLARSCLACQSVRYTPTVAPLHPWVWPTRPWERVHLDFAGPFQGSMFLVAVDAHSKWPEVEIMPTTTSAKTIEVLRKMFAAYGLPEQIVTDNGPQFISDEFTLFTRQNGIKHFRSSPYHPATNGLAERFVQSMKTALKAGASDGGTLPQCLSSFLLTYRSSPHATTGVCPCSLFLHRHVRTRLDLLRPDLGTHVSNKQAQQKKAHDRKSSEREFMVGQSVMARNLRPGPAWVPAVVVERFGPVSYRVETSDQQLWKRHVDHLKGCGVNSEENQTDPVEEDISPSTPPNPDAPSNTQSTSVDAAPRNVLLEPSPPTSDPSGGSIGADTNAGSSSARRYPIRERHPPDRF